MLLTQSEMTGLVKSQHNRQHPNTGSFTTLNVLLSITSLHLPSLVLDCIKFIH